MVLELVGTTNGKMLFIALFFLVIMIGDIKNTNNVIEKLNSENLYHKHSTVSIGGIILIAVLVAAALFLPVSNDNYDSLKEEYEDLQLKYEELQSTVENSYDSVLSLKAYVMDWPDSSKDDALKSVKDLYDRFYPEEWVD